MEKGIRFAQSFLQVVANETRAHELARLNLPPGTRYRLLRFGNEFAWALPGPRHDSDDDVKAYREKRSTETVIRHGNPSKVKVSQITINKEVGSLRKVLRFARTKGYIDKVVHFKMETEAQRNRTLTGQEYMSLLENCPPWLRRAVAMTYETCLSRSDLFRLTWNEIDLGEGIIQLQNGRGKTKAPQAIPILSPELKALLNELQAERRRVPNAGGLVLTIDGQPIDELKFEYHFRTAVKAANIHDFNFHDLRHCAITRWAAAGVPTAAAMLAAGHKSVASHKKYQNLSKADLKASFQNSKLFPTRSRENPVKQKASVK